MDKKPEDQVTVAMATYDKRIHHAKSVIYEMLGQCDRMCVCLNGYSSVPSDFPTSRKLIVVCADDKDGRPKDLGCNNKMLWLGDFPGYYATVDDDIDYPSDYIQFLKRKVDQYNKKVICSLHGHFYKNIQNGVLHFDNNRELYSYGNRRLTKDLFCHRLGLGVAMSYPASINYNKHMFLEAAKNSGDDEITAIWAQENNIPLVRVAHPNLVLIDNVDISQTNGLCVNWPSVRERIKYLESYKNWKLVTM